MTPQFIRTAAALLFALPTVFSGCERNDMHNQPKHKPLELSTFFDDGMSSRPIIPGTIARGQLVSVDMRYSGIRPPGQKVPDTFPFEITKADLKRGKQRFEIYCAVCHGATGHADGMIVQRGFSKPPSYHEQRLKDAPVGHFYDVITNGFGAMYSYNDRVYPEDRWRIAAYIKVLQMHQDQVASSAGQANHEQSKHETTTTNHQ
jgi:mono/diheme cytochrome c family protein